MRGEIIKLNTAVTTTFICITPAPNAIKLAPQTPPINAWLDEEGIPNFHVITFHKNAESNPMPTINVNDSKENTVPFSMLPTAGKWTIFPIVSVTGLKKGMLPNSIIRCTTTIAPKNSNIIPKIIVFLGLNARVDTVVANAFAASWNPLLYSKINAVKINIPIIIIGSISFKIYLK